MATSALKIVFHIYKVLYYPQMHIENALQIESNDSVRYFCRSKPFCFLLICTYKFYMHSLVK